MIYVSALALSLQQCSQENIMTELQAREYIMGQLKRSQGPYAYSEAKAKEVTLDIL